MWPVYAEFVELKDVSGGNARDHKVFFESLKERVAFGFAWSFG